MTPAIRALLMAPIPHPRNLFRSGGEGTIQDPSDINSMRQDSAGTTAAVAGQVLGRVLDQRYSLARGSELVSNPGSPFVNTTGYTSGTSTLQVVSGELELGVTGAGGGLSITVPTTAGKTYEVLIRLRKGTYTGTTFTVVASNGIPATELALADTTTLYPVMFVATTTSVNVSVARITADTGTILVASVSTREIPGSHAIQGTAGSRPSLVAPNTVDYSSGTKSLVTTFPSSLGAACTVARAVPGVGVSILTAQTIGTTYTDTTNHNGLVIINRELTPKETADVTRWLKKKITEWGSEIVAIQRSDEVDIYMRGTNPASAKYLRYRMQRKPDAGINSDVWRWHGVYECERSGAFTFTEGLQICGTGEVETAIFQTGKADYIGGVAHGDEELSAVSLTIDGNAVALGGTGTFYCSSVQFDQTSTLYEEATAKANTVAQAQKTWLFSGGSLDFTQTITWQDAIQLDTTFLTMLPLLRTSGATQVSASGFRSPDYVEEDISLAGFTEVKTTASTARTTGPSGYTARVEILDGWDKANRQFWFSNAAQYNKFYFDYTGAAYTTQISEVMSARARFTLSTSN
jgi:hypothetical protein